MSKAAIDAVFVDYRRIKGRKVHQIIFEIPSEKWAQAYAVLGEPTIDGSEWFAIAAMTGVPTDKPKGGKLAQRAGILCEEGAFKAFCVEAYNQPDPVKAIYAQCGVESRAHLDHDDDAARAFIEMASYYDAWRIAA